jgi:hypothetical protein
MVTTYLGMSCWEWRDDIESEGDKGAEMYRQKLL